MEEKEKKEYRIKKYSDVFEAYTLIDEYRKKHPSFEEAAERLSLLKARVKGIPQPDDGTVESKTYTDAIDKIDYVELKIKNAGNEVLPELEKGMLVWIDERIKSIADTPEEAEKVKSFFDNGGRDEEAFHAMMEDCDQQNKVKESLFDSLFAKIMQGLDSLIKEINAVLDSIDQALNQIEPNKPTVSAEVDKKVDVVQSEDKTNDASISVPLAEEQVNTSDDKPSAGPVKLSMNDLMQISNEVQQETGREDGEANELSEVGSIFATFNAGNENTTTTKHPSMGMGR